MLPRDQPRTPPPHLDLAPDASAHARLSGSAAATAAASAFNTPRVSTSRPGSTSPSESEGSEDESEDAMLEAIGRDDERGIEETLERLGFGESRASSTGSNIGGVLSFRAPWLTSTICETC